MLHFALYIPLDYSTKDMYAQDYIYTHSQKESNEFFRTNILFDFCSWSDSCLYSLSLYAYI